MDQEKAEEVIKKYVTDHGFEHLDELITGQSITKMDTAVYDGDKKASIRVHFINEGQTLRTYLRFNFDNPTGKSWVLNSIRTEGKVTNELADWVAKKSGLNVAEKARSEEKGRKAEKAEEAEKAEKDKEVCFYNCKTNISI
ncbi:MAG: hypothetical protein IPP15_22845 [Saprospiraceae bacterium]|uniref:Uncharacterized protein n=1 Tax=Candidatus Opimibacter skivensis TaxID=2982028 RepID=A0A9D7T0T1_9BACT|nr:hypothetical protein [Candidatus Opimibacter skivensis]